MSETPANVTYSGVESAIKLLALVINIKYLMTHISIIVVKFTLPMSLDYLCIVSTCYDKST